MQIVIDISNWLYNAIMECKEPLYSKSLGDAVRDGTPLPKERIGEWLRMSNLLEQEDNRYKCSHCGNVVHYKDKMTLYTFNSWCGRCGSDNGRKIEVEL